MPIRSFDLLVPERSKALLLKQHTPGSKNYWSDIEVTSTQYNLNIAPMCFAAWDTFCSIQFILVSEMFT